jgi:hypothetical protein
VPYLGIYSRYTFFEVAAPAKQGCHNSWQLSKAQDGSKFSSYADRKQKSYKSMKIPKAKTDAGSVEGCNSAVEKPTTVIISEVAASCPVQSLG